MSHFGIDVSILFEVDSVFEVYGWTSSKIMDCVSILFEVDSVFEEASIVLCIFCHAEFQSYLRWIRYSRAFNSSSPISIFCVSILFEVDSVFEAC